MRKKTGFAGISKEVNLAYLKFITLLYIFFVFIVCASDPSNFGSKERLGTILGIVLLYILLIPFFYIPFWICVAKAWELRTQANKNARSNTIETLRSKITSNQVIFIIIIFTVFLYHPIANYISYRSLYNGTPQEIKNIGDYDGFSSVAKRVFYEAHPALVSADELDKVCPNDSNDGVEYGCFLPKQNRIYLLKVSDQFYGDIEYTTAAHETLHALWAQLDANTRARESVELKTLYLNKSNLSYSRLHDVMSLYKIDDTDLYDELDSFVGSEVPVENLTDNLIKYYSGYFNNRNIPVQAKITFNSKLDTENQAIDASSAALDQQSGQIDAYKSQYLDQIEAYMRQNEYYGDIYTYNKNVDAYNHNLGIYKKQLDDFNSSVAAFNIRVEKYNQLIASFRPTAKPIKTR